MVSSNDRFFQHFNSPISDIYIQFKISNIINQKNVDKFCFVEGSSDELFYSTVSHHFFSKNKVKFLYVGYYDKSEYKGKKAVVLATKVVIKNFKKLAEKFAFIVDHDDFGIDEFKDEVEGQYLEMLTVLPVYSYENYYFYNNNLDRVFCSIHLSNSQLLEFKNHLDTFYDDITDYFSLKAVKTASHTLEKYKNLYNIKEYVPRFKNEDIFVFDFNDKEYYRRELAELEVSAFELMVQEHSKAKKLYEAMKKRMSINKDFLKGKILLQYMRAYCKYHFDIDINDKNVIKQINNQLEIELEVR